MSTTTPKRVHFHKEILKLSIGGTQSTQKLNTTTNTTTAVGGAIVTPSQLLPNKISTTTSSSSSSTSTNNGDTSSGKDNLINVAIRVRPLTRKELAAGQENVLSIKEPTKEIFVRDNLFNCDYLFTEKNSSQQYVYECIGSPSLLRAFDGYNVR